MRNTVLCLCLALLISLLPTGCMKLGPDYHQPDIGVQEPASYQHAPGEPTILEPEDKWWRVFNDPKLNELVEEALKNNWDIKQATAAILEVRAQLVQTRADRFPTVDLQAGAERQQRRASSSVPGQTSSVDRRVNSYDVSLPASFEIDLWGRLARAEEAARAAFINCV